MLNNIPPEHLDVIYFVVNKVKKRPFSFMTEEDIAQEAMIIACKLYEKWDGVRSLEYFLMHSVSRRLISLSRSYYKNEEKRSVLSFTEIVEHPTAEYDLVTPDLVDYILDNLSVGMRADYLRWANGVTLPAARRTALIKAVKDIVDGQ
jgi:DNA-directed RNA polymerase specialized sigma24 family protein